MAQSETRKAHAYENTDRPDHGSFPPSVSWPCKRCALQPSSTTCRAVREKPLATPGARLGFRAHDLEPYSISIGEQILKAGFASSEPKSCGSPVTIIEGQSKEEALMIGILFYNNHVTMIEK